MTKIAKPAPVATYTVNIHRATEERVVEIGTGVTESCGSDCYPYEVVEIRTPNKIVIRSMKAENGPKGQPYIGIEDWIITSDPNGRIETIRKGKNGRWKSAHGTPYSVGGAYRHHDPHF